MDKHVIKVVTGIRGCGKSVVLEQFQKVLMQKGIPENRMIYVHLDESAFAKLLDAKNLENYIVEKLQDGAPSRSVCCRRPSARASCPWSRS